MNPIGTPLALRTGMQSLPIPASASSSATSAAREDVATAIRRDDGFAKRLHERAPKDRVPARDSERTEHAHKADQAQRAERAEKTGKTETADKTHTTKDAVETDGTVPVEAPVPPVDDQPANLDVPAIAPGSVVAEALLALVGTTSAAIDPTQTTATDQDPLLTALAALLGELPQAQAVPDSGGLTATATPGEDASVMVPSMLALLGTPDATAQALPGGTKGADPLALLTNGTAQTAIGSNTGASAASTVTATDASIAADLMATPASTAATSMQAATSEGDDQAAQQPATPVMPTATTTTASDDDAPFTIAEPRPAGESPTVKPAAAPPTRAAPEAGNPMERAVANQVSRALIRESADGSRMISLRLTPPELGTVRIDIVERAGVMTARLHAEDAGVRVALERYLPQLRQDLLSHNAPVRELQLADAWAGDLTRQNHGDQQGHPSNRRSGRSGFRLDGVSAVPAGASAPARTTSTITADSVDARA